MKVIVPTLSDCSGHGIEPFEFQCLVGPGVVPEKTAGGLYISDDTKAKEDFNASRGRVVALSPVAFTYVNNWPPGTRLPQVGDVVAYPKHSGTEIEGADGKTYKLLVDKAVLAVIERGDG